MSFPVREKYVYLVRGGGYNAYMAGKGVLTEAAALIATIRTAEMSVEVYLSGPPIEGTQQTGPSEQRPVGRSSRP